MSDTTATFDLRQPNPRDQTTSSSGSDWTGTRGGRAKRLVDVLGASVAAAVFAPLALLVAAIVRVSSRGPVLHRSRRIGQFGREFEMYKFRTMRIGTPHVATHQLEDPQQYLTPVGGFLRRTSLDELPQLLNVLRGDMSLVGPRPALFNQHDLIEQRESLSIDQLRPGITGLAQVCGRDELTISEKVAVDFEYLNHASMRLDMRILLDTVWRSAKGADVAH
ncbi:MAG: sugar transferase [Acidimicrobiales bacterium]